MAVISFDNPTPNTATVPTFPAGAQAITPSDVDTYATPFTVYVGGAGTVAVRPANGGPQVTFTGLAAGATVPVKCIGVMSTGTTATSLVAVF